MTDYFSVAVGNRKKSGVDSPRFVIVRTVTSFETRKIDRRAFLFAGFAAAMGATSGATPQTPLFQDVGMWMSGSWSVTGLAEPEQVAFVGLASFSGCFGRSAGAWTRVRGVRPRS